MIRKLSNLWVVALFFSSVALGQAQTVKRLDGSVLKPAEIDATVNRLIKAAEVTGVGVAIFNDGKIVFLNAYGQRDREKNLPLTADSVMSGASFTKVVFAYMVLQLADKGLLDLGKPVYQYLPKPLTEYPRYADLSLDPRYKLINARMLLSHTTGFPNWRAFEDDRKLKIHFEPGSRYAYSGEGIDLLQLVVEEITKTPVDKLVRQYVFKPLGMTRSNMIWEPRFDSDFANGYDEYGRSLGPQKRVKPDAAGSLLTTPHDFAIFMQAVLDGKRMSSRMRHQMLSPQIQIRAKHQFPTLENEPSSDNEKIRLSYGLAWGLYWSPYGEAFFKEGHDEGWRNYAVGFDQKKSGIVIMTNSSNGEGMFKELLETLLADTFTPIEWEGYTPYEKLPPRSPLQSRQEVTVDPKLLDKYAGRYGDPPNLILIVRREGPHLSIQENGQPKQEIFPESDVSFFSKIADDVISFETDRNGRVTRMVLRTGGREIPIQRIE
jgi:CubicO group peptidase (beta-lactamase class C family)